MKQAITILLCFVILFSSGGMVLAKHYCGGELMELALYEELDSCGDGMDKTGCCDEEQQDLRHDDNTLINIYDYEPQIQPLLYELEFFSPLKIAISSAIDVKSTQDLHETGPDLLVWYQSFLL